MSVLVYLFLKKYSNEYSKNMQTRLIKRKHTYLKIQIMFLADLNHNFSRWLKKKMIKMYVTVHLKLWKKESSSNKKLSIKCINSKEQTNQFIKVKERAYLKKNNHYILRNVWKQIGVVFT